MEKVDMQGDTIAKREAQLERERAFGDLRVSLAGRAIPEDIKARLLDLQDEKLALTAEAKDLGERLRASENHVQKAKKVRTCRLHLIRLRETDSVLLSATAPVHP
jgi:protein HOOK3